MQGVVLMALIKLLCPYVSQAIRAQVVHLPLVVIWVVDSGEMKIFSVLSL